MHENPPSPQKAKKEAGFLMTYGEYLQIDHPTPYIFEVHAEEQKLLYFGAKHFFDPEDAQAQKLKEAWENFLKTVKKKDAVVLTEGGVGDTYEKEDVAIVEQGEAGLMHYLAAREGIMVESPEPPEDTEAGELLKQFQPEDILYYYFARTIAQWHRTSKSIPVEAYVEKHLDQPASLLKYAHEGDWLSTMSRIHKRIFGTSLDINDVDHFDHAEDPTTLKSVSNEVAHATSTIRDRHVVWEIEQKWKEGKSIFVVFGATHAVMQEPALRRLLEK